MKANKAEYEYMICRDTMDIYHPKENYSVQDFLEAYKIRPTNPNVLTYGRSWIETKKDFEQFIIETELKIRYRNDLHCEKYCSVEVLVLYDKKWNVKGIATCMIKDGVIQSGKEKIYL